MNNPKRIIPSLLISKGRLVKGKKFSNHKDVGNPATTSIAFSSQNADELLVCDLDSYLNNTIEPDFKTLDKISKSIMTPLTFGGGINTFEKAKQAFACGADKVFLNSILFTKTKLVEQIAKIYGSQSIMAGINVVKENGKLKIFNNPKIDVHKWFTHLQEHRIGEIKITFVNLEGTGKGLDIPECKKFIKRSRLPLIFEGGLGDLDQIILALKNNIQSISLGTMINFSDYNIIKIKQFIHNHKYKVRLR